MKSRHIGSGAFVTSLVVVALSGGCSGDDSLAPTDGGHVGSRDSGNASAEAGNDAALDASVGDAGLDGLDARADAAPPVPDGSTATFAILEATDLHTNVRSYDYFKLTEDKTIGLERTATLIKAAQKELPSAILVDNGDTIQGTVLADYQAIVSPVACTDRLAIHKAMNALQFDVGGIGNHEFNYGLAFLAQVTHTAFDVVGVDTTKAASCGGPTFPQVLSNVFSAKTDKTIFPASTILTRDVTATTPAGKTITAPLKIGVLAFAPPPILSWDKRWLDGKVYTKGVKEVAPGLVSDLRAQGADIVVAIIHGGIAVDVDNTTSPPKITPTAYAPELESQSYYLAQTPGIDVMLMGHSHLPFPDPASKVPGFNVTGVDKSAGTVNGVPAVMASFWGQHLGVIKLGLTSSGSTWTVDKGKTMVELRPIATTCTGGKAAACDANGNWRTGGACIFATACAGQPDKTKVFVGADATIASLVEPEHQGTIAYVKTPIGTTDFEMSTYFAEVGDVTAIQIVNQAQTDYVAAYVQANLPQYAALPVLSVSAPFKSGFQGGSDYTDVSSGGVAINNAADLYLFANTVYAVKVKGQTILDWLETAATRFAQIDPNKAADQELLNPGQPGYNFDSFTSPDITYEIDVTKPLPAAGQKASGRIHNLKYKGAPLDPNAEFVVATNNYRASGGGNFPGLDGSKTVYASPDTNRDILISYIRDKVKSATRAANGAARSWRFTKTATQGKVVFHSAQNKLALAAAAGLANVTLVQQDDGSGKGLSIYAVDLNNP
jgi:2',3'-cyclic-nucleotide 2'-phosphodiesterase/3'-nucleotidase